MPALKPGGSLRGRTIFITGASRGIGKAIALWPRTAIATAAMRMQGGGEIPTGCRTVEIMADAAHAILTSPAREVTGNFFIDDEVLAAAGITDLEK